MTTQSPLVERVARAICCARNENPEQPMPHTDGGFVMRWQLHADEAVAAAGATLEAAKNPHRWALLTMSKAGGDHRVHMPASTGPSHKALQRAWPHMVEAFAREQGIELGEKVDG